MAGALVSGASNPSVQLLWLAESRSDCFHTNHASRDFSVSRFSSLNPQALANSRAPAPTSIVWSVCSITSFATLDGFFMFRIDATAPHRRVGPCITEASNSTTPSSFGSPP